MNKQPVPLIQKIFGVLIIAGSLSLGFYMMDQNPMFRELRTSETRFIPKSQSEKKLVFVKDWTFPTGTSFKGIEMGGLSALSYEASSQRLYALSDDGGKKGSPRVYVWSLSFEGQVDLKLTDMILLKTKEGKPFPKGTLDPEGLVHLTENSWLISSEGEAMKGIAPQILFFNSSWQEIKELSLPKSYWNPGKKMGIRHNKGFEALSIDPSRRWIYTANEEALVQDGDVSSLDEGSFIRIAEFEKEGEDLHLTAQLPYPMEPVPVVGGVASNPEDHGLSEILALSQRKFITLERNYSSRSGKNVIQVFYVDCLAASDVQGLESLKDQGFDACSKSLALDFEEIEPRLISGHPRIDNIEGLARIENQGKIYFLFVADNNFNSSQATQFLLFEEN